MCVALRGNGERIFAHFPSQARIVEHYGPIWGSAGGSSGSITQFLLESAQINPVVSQCDGASCTPAEQGQRVALLLKSLTGYGQLPRTTPEAAAVGQFAGVMKLIKDSNVEELAASDILAARDALDRLLESDELRDLVNREIASTIANSPDPAFHVRDLIKGISSLGAFSVGCSDEELAMGCNPKTMFVGPGLLA